MDGERGWIKTWTIFVVVVILAVGLFLFISGVASNRFQRPCQESKAATGGEDELQTKSEP